MSGRPLFAVLRYRSLRAISSMQWRLNRRFTPVGQWLLGGLLAAGVLSVDTRQTVAYQAFTFVLAAVIVAMAVSRVRRRPRLSIERILPRFASAGERLLYRVVVRNQTRRAVRGLTFIEELDDPRPSFEDFLRAREPGEERRNPFDRGVGYFRWAWLVSHREVATPVEVPLPPLPPAGVCEVPAELSRLRRGRLTLAGVSMARPDALGIARTTVSVRATDSLLVLPRRYPVPPVQLPGARKYHQGGVALAFSVGDSEEFTALRDYRPGDPLRRMHWRSWAKVGKPIVKEYQREFFVRHALVLDTFVDAEPSDVFEEAVSIAASLACTIQTQESLLDLLFVGPEAHCFSAGRGLGQTERMLEVLACVRACGNASFDVLHQLVLDHYAQVSGCICVLVAWDEPRRALVRALQRLGVPTLVLVVTAADAAELDPDGVEPGRFHQLEVGRIPEGLARL